MTLPGYSRTWLAQKSLDTLHTARQVNVKPTEHHRVIGAWQERQCQAQQDLIDLCEPPQSPCPMQPLTTPHVPWQVDEKPTEHYGVIGGLDKQIQELVEAVVLPVTHADKFKKLGIKPPKGVLLYGPPGVHLGCSHLPPHRSLWACVNLSWMSMYLTMLKRWAARPPRVSCSTDPQVCLLAVRPPDFFRMLAPRAWVWVCSAW